VSGTRPSWPATLRLAKVRIKELGASRLVEAIVLRIFLSLFPLIVIAIAVIGFVAASRPGGSAKLADDLVEQLKLSGSMADVIRESVASAEGSRGATSVVGFISVLISATAVVNAIAAACNAAWQVSNRGVKDRLLGVVWLLGLGLLIGATVGVTALITVIPIPGLDALVGLVSGSIVGALLFWWTQVVMTNVRVPLRAYVPGAVFAGIGFALFQVFGTLLVARILASQSGGPASLGAVLAFLTFLTVFAWLFVGSVIVNVIVWEREHGTVQLMISAPALPNGTWAQTTRSGQRPTAGSRRGVPAFVRRRNRSSGS
jgi:membrane protein